MKTTSMFMISNDEYMCHFESKCIKSGRCAILNQNYESFLADEVFNIIST